jgi:hypothetical protein
MPRHGVLLSALGTSKQTLKKFKDTQTKLSSRGKNGGVQGVINDGICS